MFRKQNRHFMNAASVIMLTLLNMLIIRHAYISNHQFYLVLLITLPLLALALYYAFWSTGSSTGNKHAKSKIGWPVRLSVPFRSGKRAWKGLEIVIGNAQCRRPYRSSVLNMTLKEDKAAIVAAGGNAITRYRLTGGGWICQVNSGNRNYDNFNSGQLIEMASAPCVKMLELDLSGIAGSINHAGAQLFSDAEGMVHFLGNLRDYCDGKPVGARLVIGEKKAFHEICYAIRKTQIVPDYLVIEGPEDARAAAATMVNGYKLMPVYEALFFAARTLQLYGLEKEIKLIAAANIKSGFDMLKIIALGANGICVDAGGRTNIPAQPGEGSAGVVAAMHDAATHRARILNTAAGLMEVFGFKTVADITLPDFFRRMAVS